MGLISRARLPMVCRVRRCSRQRRTSALILSKASLLTAGRNEVNFFPFLARAARARKVNPKNVNDTCSCEPRRTPSLQYTIRVLAGCSRSPTCSILFCSAASTSRAWRSVAQCTTASSAYRSNWTPG